MLCHKCVFTPSWKCTVPESDFTYLVSRVLAMNESVYVSLQRQCTSTCISNALPFPEEHCCL